MRRDAKTKRIAELNDLARTAMGIACRAVATRGFFTLTAEQQSRAREAVERFDAFTKDNDPYGEHDFGRFEIDEHVLYWKIDYFDKQCEFGSEDASDASQTTRVLTIMLAEEY